MIQALEAMPAFSTTSSVSSKVSKSRTCKDTPATAYDQSLLRKVATYCKATS